MNTMSLEKELLGQERQYWQAIQDGDADAAAKLSDEECVVTGAQGVGKLSRADLKAMMEKGGGWTLQEFELSNPIVSRVTDDVATIAYKVTEKLTVDGKPVTLEAADTSTWVRRNGKWLCAAHTEAPSGDPFGRDRAKAKRQ
jgi:uncharacterized protein (TIGR02246 family)